MIRARANPIYTDMTLLLLDVFNGTSVRDAKKKTGDFKFRCVRYIQLCPNTHLYLPPGFNSIGDVNTGIVALE